MLAANVRVEFHSQHAFRSGRIPEPVFALPTVPTVEHAVFRNRSSIEFAVVSRGARVADARTFRNRVIAVAMMGSIAIVVATKVCPVVEIAAVAVPTVCWERCTSTMPVRMGMCVVVRVIMEQTEWIAGRLRHRERERERERERDADMIRIKTTNMCA